MKLRRQMSNIAYKPCGIPQFRDVHCCVQCRPAPGLGVAPRCWWPTMTRILSHYISPSGQQATRFDYFITGIILKRTLSLIYSNYLFPCRCLNCLFTVPLIWHKGTHNVNVENNFHGHGEQGPCMAWHEFPCQQVWAELSTVSCVLPMLYRHEPWPLSI